MQETPPREPPSPIPMLHDWRHERPAPLLGPLRYLSKGPSSRSERRCDLLGPAIHRCAAPAHAPERRKVADGQGHGHWSTVHSIACCKSPSTPITPFGRRLACCSTNAARAPSLTTILPMLAVAKASHRFLLVSTRWAGKSVPTSAPSESTLGRAVQPMTTRPRPLSPPEPRRSSSPCPPTRSDPFRAGLTVSS